jgi:glycosyltransferase involved in cell wall biosynthesis
MLWEVLQEGRVQRQVRNATALQCNGMPTYRQYGRHHQDALLYFDSRITPDMLAPEEWLTRKYASLARGRPLHLAFSGRLNKMKGADFLVPVALELKRLSVNFQFTILGGGDLEQDLQDEIVQHGLNDCMVIKGILDFKSEWWPFVSQTVDLFVCCHPQGDPSCTYIETFACGVPIVGFANEAFAGLYCVARAGWQVPIGDARGLARIVARLAKQPDRLFEAAARVRAFAAKHTFDLTFRARMEQLLRLSRGSSINAPSGEN